MVPAAARYHVRQRRGVHPVPGETIQEDLRNLHDRDRQTCRMVGECDVGCNYGSKNTLDYNYLSDAKRLGAEFGRCARSRASLPTGPVASSSPTADTSPWEVEHATDATPYTECEVRGRHLVVAAGTFGTNLLMQRNRAGFPGSATSWAGGSLGTATCSRWSSTRRRRSTGNAEIEFSIRPTVP